MRQCVWVMVILFVLQGCSTFQFSSEPATQYEVEIDTAPKGTLDEQASRRSEILHSYLAGQLAYTHDDFEVARSYFGKASSLLEEPTPEIHAVLAELYLKERKLEDAKHEAMRAVQGDGINPSYRLLLAGILESLKDLDGAEAQYRVILDSKDIIPQTYLLYASLLARAERLPEATAVLEKYIALAPGSVVGYEMLGRFYELEKKLLDAQKVYEEGIQRTRLTENFFRALARVYLQQDNGKAARALCEKKLKLTPRHALATRILGELAISAGSVDEGITFLRSAEALIPTASSNPNGQSSEELRFRIALLELERQNYKAAERELLLLVAQNDRHDEAKYYLASLYAGSNREEEAIALLHEVRSESKMFVKSKTFEAFLLRQDGDLEKASEQLYAVLHMHPENMKARSYLVLILRDEKKLEDARKVLQEGLKRFPEDERLLFQYAVVMQDLEHEDEALEAMEHVIRVNPQNSDALNFVAYTLVERKGDFERAEELVAMALKIRPQDGYYLDTFGWILFHQSEYGQAESILARAVSLIDPDIVVLEHYGDVLVKREKEELAIKIYQQGKEALPKKPNAEELGALKRIEKKLIELQ